MNSSINLLSNKGPLEAQKKWARIVKIIALLCVIALSSSSVILFALNRQFSYDKINNEMNTILHDMSFLHKKEEKIVVINSQLQAISEILNQRLDYYKNINQLLNVIPSNVAVEKLIVDKKIITLTFSSASLLSINDLVNNLIGLARKKEISDIKLDSLSLNEKLGSYTLSLKITL